MQPTNYIIRYYQGDDFTITIFPKDSQGGNIPIVPTDESFFNIANKRGASSTVRITGDCVINNPSDGPYAIIASLDGDVGLGVNNGFVYDIGFIKAGKTVTVLTGSFQVVERVREPE